MLTFATISNGGAYTEFVLTPLGKLMLIVSPDFPTVPGIEKSPVVVSRMIFPGFVYLVCAAGLCRPLVGPSGVFWFVFTDGAAAGKTAARFLVHRFTFGCVVQPCPSASAAGPGTHRIKSLRIWQQHLSRLCRQVYSNPEPLECQIF